jgi:hypothetical protein
MGGQADANDPKRPWADAAYAERRKADIALLPTAKADNAVGHHLTDDS